MDGKELESREMSEGVNASGGATHRDGELVSYGGRGGDLEEDGLNNQE